MELCDECAKGILHEKKVDYILLGHNLGKYNALVCDHCQETIFAGDTFQLVEAKAKEKGIWGISGKTTIGTSGNALDVKIPKQVVDFLKLRKGQEVLVEPLDQRRFQVEIV